jgi:glucose-1-phosphate thymidylyltransferase
MKALIAAGGSGTRLRPLTFSSNKHLLPVANKPLLLYPLESILETGIKEIGVVVNETRPAVETLLGDGSAWGVSITYIPQEKPLGLGHVVNISREFLGGDPFVYHLGDNIFSQGILKPFTKFEQEKPDALLTIVEHEENYRLGVPYFDSEGKLQKVVEKPQNPPHKFAVPGLYFFTSKVFEAFEGDHQVKPSARGEYEITDLYTYLLDQGYRVLTEEIDGRWMDPGKFTDMLDANAYLLDEKKESLTLGDVDVGSVLEGVVEVGEGTRIRRSTIFGPVSIGSNCLIEDSIVGPHVSIDSGCKLEQVTVKDSVVMRDSSLMAVDKPLTHSFIGKNTEVWEERNESVTLFIGDHCKVRLT